MGLIPIWSRIAISPLVPSRIAGVFKMAYLNDYGIATPSSGTNSVKEGSD